MCVYEGYHNFGFDSDRGSANRGSSGSDTRRAFRSNSNAAINRLNSFIRIIFVCILFAFVSHDNPIKFHNSRPHSALGAASGVNGRAVDYALVPTHAHHSS